MINRRQIIESQLELQQATNFSRSMMIKQQHQQADLTANNNNNNNSARRGELAVNGMARKQSKQIKSRGDQFESRSNHRFGHELDDDDDDDDYAENEPITRRRLEDARNEAAAADEEAEHESMTMKQQQHLRHQQQQQQQRRRQAAAAAAAKADYMAAQQASSRQFDPYSVYGEEDEDVWYSEERLFEDHLEEIFNKWQLLDDDIWCKLIIMERNRRIGKAYARVPIVTIDGSHELSYDGYKLALNGFDNPDRDLKTEECRKRIGKGIRIKMDNFGNILIKRLSKSGVYIKEWIQAPSSLPSTNGTSNTSGITATASSSGGATNSATSTAMGAAAAAAANNGERIMPSRRQLIKNQNAMLAGANGGGGAMMSSSSNQSNSSSSLGSSIEPTNDSAICDGVLSVGGRLEQDKIYVLFDMKKFQANITQELCRPYPDKRKLEQQCFSIVGLVRDSDDILGLPCWVMVINIVAIEVLNERFPGLMSSVGRDQHQHHHLMSPSGQYNSATAAGRAPNFVSIFEQQHAKRDSRRAGGGGGSSTKSSGGAELLKEEDPYSLPANESSSDMKSSIYGYNGMSAHNQAAARSRYYGASKHRAELHKRTSATNEQPLDHHGGVPPMLSSSSRLHKSRSNSNIYGVGGAKLLYPAAAAASQLAAAAANNSSRYNNSIYSPGHMLVLPPNSSVPPELPPRDFVSKKARSKSSSNILSNISNDEHPLANNNNDDDADRIYSTGQQQQPIGDQISSINTKVRKTKRNRFLESLKAPLELAKSSSSRSALGAPSSNGGDSAAVANEKQSSNGSSKKSTAAAAATPVGKSKSSSKNNLVRSFLGVKSSGANKQKDNNSEPPPSNDRTSEQSKLAAAAAAAATPPPPAAVAAASGKGKLSSASKLHSADSGSAEVDSVVDSSEELDEQQQQQHHSHSKAAILSSASSSAASYNDLDIPTPDYETDENIYALNEALADSSYAAFSSIAGGGGGSAPSSDGKKPSTAANMKNKNSKEQQQQNNGNPAAHTKDDLYYSGFRAHVPSNMMPLPVGKAASLMDGPTGGKSMKQAARAGSRYASHLNKMAMIGGHSSCGAPASHMQTSGRDAMIYGSTTGLSAASAGASLAGGGGAGSRYRSASMQRYYPRSQLPASAASRRFAGQQPAYGGGGAADYELEDPYADGQHHYGTCSATGLELAAQPRVSRRSGGAKQLHMMSSPQHHHGGGGFVGAPSMAASNYDIGRSSSGIYGNNSQSSSSSDYADWHPQMRKVNSSGYLNSIFKTSQQQQQQHHNNQNSNSSPVESPYGSSGAHRNHNSTAADGGGGASIIQKTKNGYATNNGQDAQRGYASRTLAPSSRSASVLSKQHQQQQLKMHQHQQQQLHGQTPLPNGGPAYRSYDSSNDSEPSYTNSSDGLDIYDHIGAQTRLSNGNSRQPAPPAHHGHHLQQQQQQLQHHHHNHHHHQHQQQYLDMQPMVAHKMAPEVHVGEWENMYDR